ncbi:MAG: hypothetical protein R2771_00720 [Saprospiraceae bacterium]
MNDYINFTRAFFGGTSPHEAMTFGENYLKSVERPDVGESYYSFYRWLRRTDISITHSIADVYKAAGYHIITIAFDNAFANSYTRDILTKVASTPMLPPRSTCLFST